MAQHLESLGHEVIVADPNYAPMYGSRSRKVKTDKRDVAALADRVSPGHLSARASGVGGGSGRCGRSCGSGGTWCRCGAAAISLLRAVLRQEGLRLPAGGARAGAAAARSG